MRLIDRKIVLEDGSEYYGYGFGSYADRVCEIVFNTSMVGYQEIVSDPSYTDQMVVMTYPLIGNYGITDDDFECKNPSIGGLIVYDYNDMPSNFRYTKTLSELLEENGIPGISGVDTRKLTRSIRDLGSRRVLITSPDIPAEVAVEIQKKRYQEETFFYNSQIPASKLKKYCPMTSGGEELLKQMFRKMGMSARGCHRIQRVARTCADLSASEIIDREHVLEACCFRNAGKKFWEL